MLNFKACSNITLSGFTAGHTKEQGSCAGGVLEFHDCDEITVDNCGLFGCGIRGVETDNCSVVTVKNCEIYECSIGGILMRNTKTATVLNTTFRDIGGDSILHFTSCSDVAVDGEVVIGKAGGSHMVQTEEQKLTNELNAAVNDFVMYYIMNEAEAMAPYIASGYEPEPWTGNREAFAMWFEVTYSQVQVLQETGSMVFEVPFRNGYENLDEEPQYLLVTIIEEDDTFKVSDCKVKE